LPTRRVPDLQFYLLAGNFNNPSTKLYAYRVRAIGHNYNEKYELLQSELAVCRGVTKTATDEVAA